MRIAADVGARAGLMALSASLLLAGCAVGPNFARPSIAPSESYTPEPLPERTAAASVEGGEAQRFVNGMDVPALWWTLFESPALNRLVERALEANPTVQSALAALRVAQENFYAQRGVYYPQVQANLNSSRQKVAPLTSSPLASGDSLFTLHTAQLNISYSLDVFGLNRRQVESLRAQAEAQRFQWEAAYLTLSANVVVAALQEASLRAQIAATQDIVRIMSEQRELMRRQLDLGAIAEASVIAHETALAQAQATLPPLQKQLAQQRHLLAVLAGRSPGEGVNEEFDLSSFHLPRELPVSLPSKLIEQRPDVRAAEAQLHSASAQVGVAIANMLPQFALTAGGGRTALEFSALLASGNTFWGVAAGLTQPIFQGGALLHRKRAAEAAYDQIAAQYRGTVLAALQNVADTLRALEFDAEALRANAAAERAAAASLAIVRRQVELGDISYLAVLSAEQAYRQALLGLIQAKANRYSDTVALFQALGGGWWNRNSTASSAE